DIADIRHRAILQGPVEPHVDSMACPRCCRALPTIPDCRQPLCVLRALWQVSDTHAWVRLDSYDMGPEHIWDYRVAARARHECVYWNRSRRLSSPGLWVRVEGASARRES